MAVYDGANPVCMHACIHARMHARCMFSGSVFVCVQAGRHAHADQPWQPAATPASPPIPLSSPSASPPCRSSHTPACAHLHACVGQCRLWWKSASYTIGTRRACQPSRLSLQTASMSMSPGSGPLAPPCHAPAPAAITIPRRAIGAGFPGERVHGCCCLCLCSARELFGGQRRQVGLRPDAAAPAGGARWRRAPVRSGQGARRAARARSAAVGRSGTAIDPQSLAPAPGCNRDRTMESSHASLVKGAAPAPARVAWRTACAVDSRAHVFPCMPCDALAGSHQGG
eukprot:364466-Chlamydomonas_euryale.AAC.12